MATLKKGGAGPEEESKQEEDRQKQYLDSSSNKFDYEKLKGQFPKGVDPTRKEAYLTEEQFVQVMGMSSDSFNALKKWKQTEIRKAKELF